MDNQSFLQGLLPGNYFITKSMEMTQSGSAGTLWYIKKFIVLYYYIFLGDNIATKEIVSEICRIFDDYIKSLPEKLTAEAKKFFYASSPYANLKDDKFRLFDYFAGIKPFKAAQEKIDFYECAKKYYFAFLMESGGQSGVNKYIKECMYKEDFQYSKIDSIIECYANDDSHASKNKHLEKYKAIETRSAAITGMRNDYMAFVRNDRQILFYYGFFHSKSSGAKDREFSSLTPVGELALKSNYYELIALWEHQKIKMVSQPVTITIEGLKNTNTNDSNNFRVNRNPYLTIVQCLSKVNCLSKEEYQFVVSRLPEFPDDFDTCVMKEAKEIISGFGRQADLTKEDFNKEMSKYILGIRDDLKKDDHLNPIGFCEVRRNSGYHITNSDKSRRFIELCLFLAKYKNEKYGDLFSLCESELRRQYKLNVIGTKYTIDPQTKIKWDMYIIHADLLILLTMVIFVTENLLGIKFSYETISIFEDHLKNNFSNIIKQLGFCSKKDLTNELKFLSDALDNNVYDKYLEELQDKYYMSLDSYLGATEEGLEKKIQEKSEIPSIYIDGVRKRNVELIKLIKSYDIKKYSNNGTLSCECCGKPTFVTYRNEPYVEYHHLIPFSKYDGPDHVLNILALCPLCHSKMHYVKTTDKANLYNNIEKNSYDGLSVEERLTMLFSQKKLKSYQLEFLLADKAIDQDAYNRILKTT